MKFRDKLSRLFTFWGDDSSSKEWVSPSEPYARPPKPSLKPKPIVVFKVGDWARVSGTDLVGEVRAVFGKNGMYVFIRLGPGVYESRSYHFSELERLG